MRPAATIGGAALVGCVSNARHAWVAGPFAPHAAVGLCVTGAYFGGRVALAAEATSQVVNLVAGDAIGQGVQGLTKGSSLFLQNHLPISADEANSFAAGLATTALLGLDAKGAFALAKSVHLKTSNLQPNINPTLDLDSHVFYNKTAGDAKLANAALDREIGRQASLPVSEAIVKWQGLTEGTEAFNKAVKQINAKVTPYHQDGLVIGRAQSTDIGGMHKAAIEVLTDVYKSDPNTAVILRDQGINKALGIKLDKNVRGDIMILNKDGSARFIEVQSLKQDPKDLTQKIGKLQTELDKHNLADRFKCEEFTVEKIFEKYPELTKKYLPQE